MTSFVVPISLPTATRKVEAHKNIVELAIAIDVIDTKPAEAVAFSYAPLVVRRSRHNL